MSPRRFGLVGAVVMIGLLFFSQHATAQHADFVLFGQSKAAAKEISPEHRFVHPITSPYFNEDPFVTTDLRAWFLYHDFPNPSPIDGGSAKVYAVQVRLALLDQLQLIANKDGYIDNDSGLSDEDGWNNLAGALKWNFIQNWEHQFHAAVGAGLELPTGDDEVLQDYTEFRVFGSVAKGFGPFHLGFNLNAFFAENKDDNLGHSDRLSWHAHVDYYVCKWFSPVVEFNGYHVIDKGTEIVPFSGIDVANLGGGDDVVTIGIGGELRPVDNVAVRAAYETPLTHGDDLFGYRWTFSAIFSF